MKDQNEMEKAYVRVERFSALKFTPRFEYDHMAEVAQTYCELATILHQSEHQIS